MIVYDTGLMSIKEVCLYVQDTGGGRYWVHTASKQADTGHTCITPDPLQVLWPTNLPISALSSVLQKDYRETLHAILLGAGLDPDLMHPER